ncbi:hypothetical protein CHRY9390_02012 [Chryseobacterium aquaeductus]|uniref:DUF3078 domain-containing protein n=1 Tax=Chryseobacterium aquaeductus TaxID=2675056 RepID=A0A9N8MP45_9FLAO|nr:hypothetical protein [Chryseobacterium aquaeductus]CAA7331313.1 hypothetical protein CHRY9390_02012 [Chryseobacterium potabilaquae]CAD7809457.1 hypothetical protein CHRY9390_02012 [Chryseobacterium aquaeductus]
MKMKSLYFLISVFCVHILHSQTLIHHTTNYFGPNANPVPEFTDALIPESTILTLTGDYYFGHGDRTLSNNMKVEIPLIPEKVSVKVWKTLVEYYYVKDEIVSRRSMQKNSGFATGDFYIQTRIKILSEKINRPAFVLNSTLKTASGSDFKNRRFFNTAGYYFDFELGKSLMFSNSFIDEIRLVSDIGFFSWDVQTPNLNVQDDAIVYGLKLILKHKSISLENTFSGYKGWIRRVEDYGNRPIVFSSKLNFNVRKTLWFVQFQYGIKYFPYEQIRLGVQIPLENFTPNFFGKN